MRFSRLSHQFRYTIERSSIQVIVIFRDHLYFTRLTYIKLLIKSSSSLNYDGESQLTCNNLYNDMYFVNHISND